MFSYYKNYILKESTHASPSNGYYFLPIYDKGEYTIRATTPDGWTLDRVIQEINFDGVNDQCSRGEDINFVFEGFGISGSVEFSRVYGNEKGAGHLRVELRRLDGKTDAEQEVRSLETGADGRFYFTPVNPGKYLIVASEKGWQFQNDRITVEVANANVEIPAGSIVVSGVPISGKFDISTLPPHGRYVSVSLFQRISKTDDLSKSDVACSKNTAESVKVENHINANFEKTALCVVNVDRETGEFKFAAVPNNEYIAIAGIRTELDKQVVHVEPKFHQFRTGGKTIVLPVQTAGTDKTKAAFAFHVTGYNFHGRVLLARGGNNGVADATVKLDGKQAARTDKRGEYTLENLAPGAYLLQVVAADVQFTDQKIQLVATKERIDDASVSSYKVCGQVVSPNSYTVALTKQASTFHTQTATEKGTGTWCAYLPVGRYNVEVLTTSADLAAGVQFFPLQQTVEVHDSPLSGIVFSQLRAVLRGTIQCLSDEDATCRDVTVTLLALDAHGKETGQRSSAVAGGRFLVRA